MRLDKLNGYGILQKFRCLWLPRQNSDQKIWWIPKKCHCTLNFIQLHLFFELLCLKLDGSGILQAVESEFWSQKQPALPMILWKWRIIKSKLECSFRKTFNSLWAVWTVLTGIHKCISIWRWPGIHRPKKLFFSII